ncbi:MAG: flagellar biosynthesis protein FlhB [Planctomycetota bacterium JB042]
MADQDKEQKTEDPTEKRRQKGREDGKVPRSPDLTFAVLLLTCGGLAILFGDGVRTRFLSILYACAESLPSATDHDAILLANATAESSLRALLPFFLGFVPAALVSSFFQTGLHYVPAKLRPRPEKLAPTVSVSKFVNGRSLIETVTSLLKFVFLAIAFHLAVAPAVGELMVTHSLPVLVAEAGRLIVRLLLFVGGTLLALGLLDYLMKVRQNEKDLKMTKEEVKQENKDAMGDPEVRGRIKRKQREVALTRMMEAVPEASVVVTNPTHYAVALKYESSANAPRCVAKGRDLIALRIREIAREADVPVVEDPPLARALHGAVEVGDEIPPTLYQAVAELLAAVMRTRGRVGARR